MCTSLLNTNQPHFRVSYVYRSIYINATLLLKRYITAKGEIDRTKKDDELPLFSFLLNRDRSEVQNALSNTGIERRRREAISTGESRFLGAMDIIMVDKKLTFFHRYKLVTKGVLKFIRLGAEVYITLFLLSES